MPLTLQRRRKTSEQSSVGARALKISNPILVDPNDNSKSLDSNLPAEGFPSIPARLEESIYESRGVLSDYFRPHSSQHTAGLPSAEHLSPSSFLSEGRSISNFTKPLPPSPLYVTKVHENQCYTAPTPSRELQAPVHSNEPDRDYRHYNRSSNIADIQKGPYERRTFFLPLFKRGSKADRDSPSVYSSERVLSSTSTKGISVTKKHLINCGGCCVATMFCAILFTTFVLVLANNAELQSLTNKLAETTSSQIEPVTTTLWHTPSDSSRSTTRVDEATTVWTVISTHTHESIWVTSDSSKSSKSSSKITAHAPPTMDQPVRRSGMPESREDAVVSDHTSSLKHRCHPVQPTTTTPTATSSSSIDGIEALLTSSVLPAMSSSPANRLYGARSSLGAWRGSLHRRLHKERSQIQQSNRLSERTNVPRLGTNVFRRQVDQNFTMWTAYHTVRSTAVQLCFQVQTYQNSALTSASVHTTQDDAMATAMNEELCGSLDADFPPVSQGKPCDTHTE